VLTACTQLLRTSIRYGYRSSVAWLGELLRLHDGRLYEHVAVAARLVLCVRSVGRLASLISHGQGPFTCMRGLFPGPGCTAYGPRRKSILYVISCAELSHGKKLTAGLATSRAPKIVGVGSSGRSEAPHCKFNVPPRRSGIVDWRDLVASSDPPCQLLMDIQRALYALWQSE